MLRVNLVYNMALYCPSWILKIISKVTSHCFRES